MRNLGEVRDTSKWKIFEPLEISGVKLHVLGDELWGKPRRHAKPIKKRRRKKNLDRHNSTHKGEKE